MIKVRDCSNMVTLDMKNESLVVVGESEVWVEKDCLTEVRDGRRDITTVNVVVALIEIKPGVVRVEVRALVGIWHTI